jgi:hypothetical protein
MPELLLLSLEFLFLFPELFLVLGLLFLFLIFEQGNLFIKCCESIVESLQFLFGL